MKAQVGMKVWVHGLNMKCQRVVVSVLVERVEDGRIVETRSGGIVVTMSPGTPWYQTRAAAVAAL